MNEKPIWASKTFWTNLVAVVAALAGGLGFGGDLGADTQAAAVAAIMGLANIGLRIVSKGPVSLGGLR